MFRELFLNEAKVTVSSVKKAIKGVNLEILLPQAFEVEKKSTDAGMGGYDYIAVFARDLRTKDQSDVKLVIDALKRIFGYVRVKEQGKNLVLTIEV